MGSSIKIPSNYIGYAQPFIWWDYYHSAELPPATNAIRANSINDLFIAGYNLNIRHYNGKSWMYYSEVTGNGEWHRLSVLNDMIVCSGVLFENTKTGLIARGYRE